jgi:hypothetical protein
VSDIVSRDRGETGGSADAPASGQAADAPEGLRAAAGTRRHGRLWWVVPGVVVMVIVGGVLVAWRVGAFSRPASPTAGQGAAATATQPVVRTKLSVRTSVDGTLGYAGSHTVTGAGGTLTSLPSVGQVIRQGQVLYTTDLTDPVMLLYGSVPDWRVLDEGVKGADVTELNHDLVALGYADRADISALGWDYFSWETEVGVKALQSAAGISDPSGSLAARSVVFEPGAIRVARVLGNLGSPAAGPVLSGTSDRHVVSVALTTADESEVAVGDAVSIGLPDGARTPGKISSVGTVATGSGSSATVPVTVTLTHPSAAGSLDQAPVTVEITADSVRNALAVPVSALLAQSSGGYAVEVTGPDNTRRLVPVTVGIFDDSSSLVQVTGNLTPGERVVVPST